MRIKKTPPHPTLKSKTNIKFETAYISATFVRDVVKISPQGYAPLF